jgi:hypothetical protein
MIDKFFNIGFGIHFQFNCFEWLIGLITTFGLIYFLRARILVNDINIVRNKNGNLIRFKIPVINDSRFFSATNVIIETTIIKGNLTYHFRLDKNEFILIPKKCSCRINNQNERSFQTVDFDNSTRLLTGRNDDFQIILNEIMEDNTKLRIRIHANHEFTNFGKAFEFYFRYENGNFIKL